MTAISEEELRQLVERIIASGELGRSRTYGAILTYLMECSITGEQPKEMAIAVDVLGREADFDVGRDSIVRVHLYHLRSKLDAYYKRHGKREKWRLEIPRGQYLLTVVPNDHSAPAVPDDGKGTDRASALHRLAGPWLSAALALLLTASLLLPLGGEESAPTLQEQAAGMNPWQQILDDDTPILLVVGDYFIFGELDEQGNVARMVRDFSINSAEDLELLYLMEPEVYQRYYNLDLSYIPTSAANALMKTMPLLAAEHDRTRMKMMSELTAADMTGNHIVYVGYISGLGRLEDMVFAGSGLRVGNTYDELVTVDGEQRFASNAGLRGAREEFRDFALASSFPTPRGHQVVVLAGMRDAGLIAIAQELGQVENLRELNTALEQEAIDKGAWEALFEVYGMDHTNFDARRVYAGELEAGRIWGGEN